MVKTYVVLTSTVIFLAVFIVPSYAQKMTSGNYSTFIDIDEGGGFSNSTNYKTVASLNSVMGISNSTTYKVCMGYICVEFGPGGQILSVTFLLDTSIRGSSDQAYVDNNSAGLYTAGMLQNLFGCIQNPTIADTPVFGIVGAGSIRYIRLDQGTTYALRVSENQPGNRFIIPITSGGCAIIRNRLPLSSTILPFVAGVPIAANALELSIKYPVTMIGEFEKTGRFTLILEKNQSQIIGTPV